MICMFCRSHIRLQNTVTRQSRKRESLGCVSRDARLTNIPPQHVLYLFWLEAALDDQPPRTVDTSSRTHLSKEKLNDVFWRSVHTLANIGDVCKDGTADTFSEDLRWSNGVPLSCGSKKGRIGGVKGNVETCEELHGYDS